jgi:hypothetical protein
MNATLNGKQHKVAFNYATFFEFEERFGKTLFEVTTQRSVLELYYCTLIANNEEFIAEYPDFNAFLEALENDTANTVEATCTTCYVLYCEVLKKKILQNKQQKS